VSGRGSFALRACPSPSSPFDLISPSTILGSVPCRVWVRNASWPADGNMGYGVGMKTDGTGGKTPQPFPFFIFYYGKRERERNSRVGKRKRDITVMETGGNRKIYWNALLFNHHSLCMNITLDTPLHKLFSKNIINISCFL